MSKKKTAKGKNTAKSKTDEQTGKVVDYEKELFRLQAELVKLQYWVRATGQRIVVVFEGRDGAGKGGVIQRIMERVSPRVFHVEALATPSDRERTQFYFQRYIARFPAAGEVVLFDRSWYNRAGVERVMGFCTEAEYKQFLRVCPHLEEELIDSGIVLIKYWLEIGAEEQTRRFLARINDPTKIWKLSPMDLESHKRWFEYSRARDEMFAATDTDKSPWYVVPSDSKKLARLNCIAHFLSLFPYEDLRPKNIKLPKRRADPSYREPNRRRHLVPLRYMSVASK